jgi:hypothetical protein
MTQEVENFVKVRSFLAGHVEVILENLTARRESSKIDSEDLFAADAPTTQGSIQWHKNYPILKRLDVLLAEKDSLGLYVSGNPLMEYQGLLDWVRDSAGRDDVFLIIIEKIKKIFTKAGTMMFALQISMAEKEVEGIIFPKNAIRLSGRLEEKELYWVKGNINERGKGKKKGSKNGEETESENGEEGVQEFVELPKLIIEEINRFEEGVLPLFEGEEIKLSANRSAALSKIDWLGLKTNPKQSVASATSQPPEASLESPAKGQAADRSVWLRLPNTLSQKDLVGLKKLLRHEPGAGARPIRLEIQDSQGNWKKVKGQFWLNLNELPAEFQSLVQ